MTTSNDSPATPRQQQAIENIRAARGEPAIDTSALTWVQASYELDRLLKGRSVPDFARIEEAKPDEREAAYIAERQVEADYDAARDLELDDPQDEHSWEVSREVAGL